MLVGVHPLGGEQEIQKEMLTLPGSKPPLPLEQPPLEEAKYQNHDQPLEQVRTSTTHDDSTANTSSLVILGLLLSIFGYFLLTSSKSPSLLNIGGIFDDGIRVKQAVSELRVAKPSADPTAGPLAAEPARKSVRFADPHSDEIARDSISKGPSESNPIVTGMLGNVNSMIGIEPIGSPEAGSAASASVPDPERVEIDDEEVEGSLQTPPKPKKKAHRGQRGGRKKRALNGSAEQANDGRDDQLVKDITVPDAESFLNSSGETIVGNLTVSTRVLGSGSGGTFVFEGNFEGRDVAVKRMLPQYYELATQEVSLLQQSDDHPNVVRYFCQQKNEHFLYIAVELCQASLWDLFKNGHRDEEWKDSYAALVAGILRDPQRALYQLAAGLSHLHSLRIIHRDIKPQNILIAYPRKNVANGPLRLVISDFGLCKTLPENVSTLVGTTGNAGTVGWKAPELISTPREASSNSNGHSFDKLTSEYVLTNGDSNAGPTVNGSLPSNQGVKRACDIFSLGLVFYYVLTSGAHPFDDEEGWMQIRELNIKKNKMNLGRLRDIGGDAEEPIHLIEWMLEHRPEQRPTAQQVMRHPFFWSAEKRLAFLCDVSDHFEREPRDPPSDYLLELESRAPTVAGKDFLAKLDRKFVDTLGKQRKYVGSRILDLLRALRNKKNHYEDMPADVQARVGALPGGYLNYWMARFPGLLLACYEVVGPNVCGLQTESRFRPYFEQPGENGG